MPKMVCRITWRKGMPLGLAVYPSPTFLDLPREIRDKIYWEALVVSRPTTVSSNSTHIEDSEESTKYNIEGKVTTIHQTYTCLSRDAVLDKIALGLLRCHPVISVESAVTFYQSNTFYFGRDEVWSPLYTFLTDIRSNRVLLCNISIEMAEPYKGLYQDQYRARILQHHGSLALFSPVYSSSSHPLVSGPSSRLVSPPSSTPRSVPDHYRTARPNFEEDWSPRLPYFDPAIKACFRLLGQSQLTLSLIRVPAIPGIEDGGLAPSLELANFIEAVRQGFAEQVTVLWNCQVVGPRNFLIKEADSIQSKGWEIVKAKLEPPRVHIFPGISREPSSVDSRFYITHLVLRRTLVDQILSSFCEPCCMEWPPNAL